MDTQPTLTARDLLAHVIGDIAKAVGDRARESLHQRAARTQAAAQTIAAFQPYDVIEAMLAGHCLMFHEMIVDSVHHILGGEEDAARRSTRSSIVAMDKAFGNNLARLERYQTRRAEASPEAQPTNVRAETDIAERLRRHQSQSQDRQPPAAAQGPSPETIAANPEAMAALDIADPTQSANALGQTYLPTATAQMSGFNGHAVGNSSQTQRSAYAGNRQARRHPTRNDQATKTSVAAAN